MIRSPAKFLRLLLLVSGVLSLVAASAFVVIGQWDGAQTSLAAPAEPTSSPRPAGIEQMLGQQFYEGFLRLEQRFAPTPTPTPKPTATPRPTAIPQPQSSGQPASPPPSQPQQPPPPAAPPAAQPSCPTAGMSGYGASLFNAINAERAAAGMPALAAHGCVTYVAQLRSDDMASRGYFSHTSPEGVTAFSLLDTYGVPYGWAGENLARNNYPNSETVGVAIRDLMASQGHRANILSGNFTHLGVAVATDGAGMKYFTMVFIGAG